MFRAFEYLARDSNLIMLIVADRALGLIVVVKHDGNSGLRHAGLPLLVHKILQAPGADLSRLDSVKQRANSNQGENRDIFFNGRYLRKIGDAEHEADSIQNVRFSRPI